MAAAIRAEWFKLVRRRAMWLTIGLMLALAVGIEYFLVYVVATHPPAGAARVHADLSALRTGLYPDSVIKKSLANASSLVGIFAVIVGVLAQGSEYSWATVKTAFVQLPGRLSIMTGQLVSLAALALIMVAGLFIADAAASYVIGAIDSKSPAWPSVIDLVKGVGAGWLILYFLTVLGFGLATLFRQSAMAIGLGLAYVLIIENLVFGLLVNLGDTFKRVQEWFPIANAGYLEDAFGRARSAMVAPVTSSPVDAAHAVIVLALWLAGLAAMSAVLVRTRDVA